MIDRRKRAKHSQLQLALRHPGNAGYSAQRARDLCENIIKSLEAEEPALGEVLRMGFDPKHDVPVSPPAATGGPNQPPHAATELEQALAESVRLQSHYAELLNGHDGGQRMTFENAEAWIATMRQCGRFNQAWLETEGNDIQ